MWIFMARPPRPDASPWLGRRAFAALDAVLWPLLCLVAISSVPFQVGALGWVAVGVASFAAIVRIRRALWRNERYWFTTSRWGVPIATLVAIGFAISLLAQNV